MEQVDATCDYVKVGWTIPTAHLSSVHQAMNDRILAVKHHIDTSGDEGEEMRLYREYRKDEVFISLEAWGPSAEEASKRLHLFFAIPGARLLRYDYREELIDNPDFDRLQAIAMKRSRSNVERRRSRVRSKAGDRDAGGESLSIGSHKSTRRLVIYRRALERSVIELTLRGALLHKVFANALETITSGVGWPDITSDRAAALLREEFHYQLLAVREGMVWNAFGAGTYELLEQTRDVEEMEDKSAMKRIRRAFRLWTPAQQQDFLQELFAYQEPDI